MIKNIYWLMLIFVLNSGALASDADTFSVLEKKMDQIANQYSSNNSMLLSKMEELLAQTPNATVKEKSLFLAYDCSLRARLAPKLAQERYQQLKLLSVKNNNDQSVRAATALCESTLISTDENLLQYQSAMYKAFVFVQKAETATLRYWISLVTFNIFSSYGDYQNSEKALLIGLNVAKANNDSYRLTTTHQMLAELYVKMNKFSKALHHNEQAQLALDNSKTNGQWDQPYLDYNRGLIAIENKNYQLAIKLIKKTLVATQKNQQLQLEQFYKLELLYTYILTNNLKEALILITEVTDYANTYDSAYYMTMVNLAKSYISLSTEDINQSILFEQSMAELKSKHYVSEQLIAWKRRIKIANMKNKFTISNHAMTEYLLLQEQSVAQNYKDSQLLTSQTFEKIIQDDNEIANKKFEETVIQETKREQYNKYLLWIIYLLVTLLSLLTLRFGWILIKKYKHNKEELNNQRYCDSLTGSYNRRYFKDKVIPQLIDDSKAKQISYLIILDIDHFKVFNDTYGHSAGDLVLKELVTQLKSDSRLQDSVIRMGGEEFLIALPPNPNLRIEVFIERMLKLITQNPVIIEDSPKTVTVSIGYVPITQVTNAQDIEDMIELADKALYLAKGSGRNQAFGVSQLQCPASFIDNIEIARDNKLLVLTQIKQIQTT